MEVQVEGRGYRSVTKRVTLKSNQWTQAVFELPLIPRKARVYFIVGHGEARIDDTDQEGYSYARQGLEEANYDVRTLLLVQEDKVPDDCLILVVAGAQKEFLRNEVDLIRKYIEQGGKALFLFDPGVQVGLESMLEVWGVNVGNDVVVDVSELGQLFGIGGVGVPIADQYGSHPITEKHKGITTFYPLARTVSFRKGISDNVDGIELTMTHPSSWAETDLEVLKGRGAAKKDPGEKRGPIPLSVAVTVDVEKGGEESLMGNKQARLVVFGDSDFAKNRYLPQRENGVLFLNCISWLGEEPFKR